MTPKILNKKTDRPDPAKTYIALEPIAGATRTIRQGEKLPGSDPYVAGNFRSFVDEAVPPEERPNVWHLVNDLPPQNDFPDVIIRTSAIPAHRQVRSTVDVYTDTGFAPGSPGAKSGRPSGYGSAIRMNQVFDALDPVVRANPSWFKFPERDVHIEDIERLEREQLAGEAAA